MPRFVQSIRFRLSLTIALVVFAVGSLLIGGLYVWQVNQLDAPPINFEQFEQVNPRTGETERVVRITTQGDFTEAVARQLAFQAERKALEDLRRGSFFALAILFVASFAGGYLTSGWALRPIARLTGVARDISVSDLSRRIDLVGPEDELKNMADTFDGMLDRIQDAFEDQRRFVHEASHELRNPLAIAQTNLELALDSGEREELERAAGIALRSTNRMGVLVEDLLEQARHGSPDLVRVEVDLSRLVADIASEFQAAAKARRLSIEAHTDDQGGDDVVVHGDGPALRRAVSNLVANSVRLAPEGSTIRLCAARQDDCAAITVSDEGPGIPPSEHDAIFQRFWRGSNAGKGSGLGLSIVRRIAERHGGTVLVTSDVGQGSTFTLRLPAPIHPR